MSGTRIYVDFDDVLCETAEAFLDVVEREFGRRYAFEEIEHFDLEASFHLNPDEYDFLMGQIHRPDLLRTMAPMPGMGAVLNDWHQRGVEVVVVTGRPPETEDVCHEWLTAHRLPYERIIFVDKYGRIPVDQVGVQVVRPEALIDMGFSMAVEDAPAMISFIMEKTDIPLAILDRPWNRAMDLSGREAQVVRCTDWAAIARAFNARG